MSRASWAGCSAEWMLEAARAGQLTPAEAAQLREHLQSGCAACKREKRYLEWLSRSLFEREPVCDEVALRRLRRATLQRARDSLYRAPLLRRRRAGVLAGAVLMLAIAIGTWHGFGRTPEVVVTPLTAAGPVQRRSEADREIVVLGDGVYDVSVRRSMFDRQVVVRVPEGDIQDVGTVFGVSVQHGKTARVAVTQGAVVLRLRGVPELRLEAGSAWEPQRLEVEAAPLEEHAEPASEKPLPSLAVVPPPGIPEPAKRGLATHARQRHERQSAQHPVSAPERLQASDPGNVEREGASEDATYLRVLDLLRQRRTADAQRLAELYLERFPRGFRRPEVERIARPARSQ